MNYTLFHDRSMFIELNDSTHEGFTESGIKLARRDFTLTGTWKNTARVLMAHPTCWDVHANDLIVFRKHAPKRLGTQDGDVLCLMEYQVLGIVRKTNGEAWFI